MTEKLDALQRLMEAAAATMNFEEAGRLRDRISLIRGGGDAKEVGKVDTTGLDRQQPGRMGLGTSQQRMTPPPGWKPPKKPDPMTKGQARPRGRRRGGTGDD